MKYIGRSILVITLSVIIGTAVYAQPERRGLMVRKLFVDYKSPQTGDAFDFQQWNSGFDIGYLRKLNDRLTLMVPLTVASVRHVDSLKSSLVLGIDARVKYSLLKEEKKANLYVSAGIGFMTENFDLSYAAAPAAFGVDIKVAAFSYINMELGYRFGFEDERDNVFAAIGFNHFFGKEEPEPIEEPSSDFDGDGIPDDVDLCPETPGLEVFMGCPDTDGDGLQDSEDDCPTQPGPKELDGCPDTDGDGLSDKDDECPNIAGPISNNGCPIPDRDGDGVLDAEDRCPDDPGPRYLDGCPDRDGDGVADIDDRCPDDPGPASNLGCPELKEEAKEILAIAMENVEFDFNKATLRSESFDELDAIAQVMREYPAYKLRISGHTDSVGSDEINQSMSERRARSCFEYLSSIGIPTGRMSHVGFGETRPIESNDTAAGRARNRRVEFDLYVE